MGSKNEASIDDIPSGLLKELQKVDDKLSCFGRAFNSNFDEFLEELREINNRLSAGNNFDDPVPTITQDALKASLVNIKAHFDDILKKHREIHINISKFGKAIDKTFIDDLSHIASYFNADSSDTSPPDDSQDGPPVSSLYKNADDMSKEELFSTIIIEDLIRNGHGASAIYLCKEVGLSEEDVGLKQFCEVGEMVAALKSGKLGPAKIWLAQHSSSLKTEARQLEYVLAKLDFLVQVQQCVGDSAAIIKCMQNFVGFATEFPADFEHVMGSLVFLGHSLEGTPYADLAIDMRTVLSDSTAMDTEQTEEENGFMSDRSAGGVASPLLPLMCLSADYASMIDTDAGSETPNSPVAANAFVRAARLFGTLACTKLGLSNIDPLRTAFASGLRVLPKLHTLQHAIAEITKFGSSSGASNTLPIPVELDGIAHRHNIFHCPVIKEVTNMTNTPVRLTCGHAISRDAFNSLASSDRRFVSRKVKCPYCPVDTHKNQYMDLYF